MPENSAPIEVEIAIIGAGVGGLALAAALALKGKVAHVYERQTAITAVGGGLTLDQVTVKILDDWGLKDEFMKHAILLDGFEARTHDGEAVGFFPLPDIGSEGVGVDVPDRDGIRDLYGAMRADLQTIVFAHVPDEQLHLDMRMTSIVEERDHVVATFEDGTVVHAKLLVGADGIRSLARRMLTPEEPILSNSVVCSTIVPASVLPEGWANNRMRFWAGYNEDGSETHTLFCPVRAGKEFEIGTSMVNGDLFTDLAGSQGTIAVETLLTRYPDTTDPIIMHAFTASKTSTFRWAIYDQVPLATWVTDRVALIGDAAHSVRPNLGQGACLAIQDADELARRLTENDDLSTALKEYEKARVHMGLEVQRVSKEIAVAWSSSLHGAGGPS